MWMCVFIAVLCHGLSQGFNLTKFKFEDYCGSTLQKNAGILSFTADDLRTYDLKDNQCSVTVKVIPTRSYSTIMFYFERFYLSGACEDESLTMTQKVGSSRQKTTRIPGLPDHMCGKNNSILQYGLNFTTAGEEFTIKYKFGDNGKRLTGEFTMKFLEFHTGTCDEDHRYKCEYTERCIREEYHCNRDIRGCPLTDYTCIERTEPLLVTLLKMLGVLVMVGLLCSLPRLRCDVLHRLRECTKRRSPEGRIDDAERPSLPRETVIDSTVAPANNNRAMSGPIDPITLLRIELGTQGSPSLTSSHSDVSLEASIDDTASYSHDNNHHEPPPSYDEVIAPLYEEVLANTTKYKTSLL